MRSPISWMLLLTVVALYVHAATGAELRARRTNLAATALLTLRSTRLSDLLEVPEDWSAVRPEETVNVFDLLFEKPPRPFVVLAESRVRRDEGGWALEVTYADSRIRTRLPDGRLLSVTVDRSKIEGSPDVRLYVHIEREAPVYLSGYRFGVWTVSEPVTVTAIAYWGNKHWAIDGSAAKAWDGSAPMYRHSENKSYVHNGDRLEQFLVARAAQTGVSASDWQDAYVALSVSASGPQQIGVVPGTGIGVVSQHIWWLVPVCMVLVCCWFRVVEVPIERLRLAERSKDLGAQRMLKAWYALAVGLPVFAVGICLKLRLAFGTTTDDGTASRPVSEPFSNLPDIWLHLIREELATGLALHITVLVGLAMISAAVTMPVVWAALRWRTEQRQSHRAEVLRED